jgi:glycosyltransferase involved in cell wall biosynthesis
VAVEIHSQRSSPPSRGSREQRTVKAGATPSGGLGAAQEGRVPLERRRVLVLITLAEMGGAQRYVASLLPALVTEYAVTVAAHGHGFLADAATEAGARYVPLRHVRRPLDPIEDVLGFIELVRLCRRVRPAIVHANSSKAGILGRLAAVVAGVPVRLFTAHGWAFKAHSGLAARAYLWADRAMTLITTTTICVAESERNAGLRARTCRADRTVVIHNGVAPGRRRRPRTPGPQATVVSVGRLRAPKDFLTLVRAAATLEPGSFRLRIAGDGPDHERLVEEIDRLGLAAAVDLLGTQPDVDALLEAADVFVLSSTSEGLPMSVLEAMAAGLPVVASAVGGVPELVDGETGALVPPADPGALAAALARLGAEPRLRARLGAAGRRRAEAEFGLADFHRAHLAVYRAALDRAANPNQTPRRNTRAVTFQVHAPR